MKEHQQLIETEDQKDARRWWLLLLLLLLLAFSGLFCSSQWAILTGFDEFVSAKIASDNIAAYNLDEEELIVEIGQLDPVIIEEATLDAGVLQITPSPESTEVVEQIVVLLPSTNTPTATVPPTATSTPSTGPVSTSTPTRPPPANTPTPTPTSPSLSTNTPTPTSPPPTGTFTPTPTSPPPTNTLTPTPSPSPLPTNTLTPTPSPIPLPTDTLTPTPSPSPPPTDTPIPPTDTPTPTPTPVLSVIIEPDRARNANQGETITYTHVVTNSGNVSGNFNLTISSSQGFPVSRTPASVNLGPGGSMPVTVVVTVPLTAMGGITDITTITATSSISAAIYDTATDATHINVIAGVIIAPDNSGSADPGDRIVYTHTVTNIGNSPDNIAVVANSNQGFDAIVQPSPLFLNPSQSALVTVTITVPVISNGNITDTTTVTATSGNVPGQYDTAINTTFVNAPPPISFTLNAADGDQLVSLGWLNAPAPLGYIIQYAVNNGPWQPLIVTLGTADRYYHTPIINGLTYYYQATAFYSSTLRYSNIATATPGLIVNRTTVTCTSALSVTVGIGTVPSTCERALIGVDAPGISLSNPPFSGTVIIGDPDRPGELVLDYDVDGGIIDGPGYDVVLFELLNRLSILPYVGLDYTILEVSETATGPWITVFSWDGIPGYIANTNVYSYSSETEGLHISPSILYPDPSPSTPPNENTGIAINISPYAPAGIKYRYIRLAQPPLGNPGTQVQVDAVYRRN